MPEQCMLEDVLTRARAELRAILRDVRPCDLVLPEVLSLIRVLRPVAERVQSTPVVGAWMDAAAQFCDDLAQEV